MLNDGLAESDGRIQRDQMLVSHALIFAVQPYGEVLYDQAGEEVAATDRSAVDSLVTCAIVVLDAEDDSDEQKSRDGLCQQDLEPVLALMAH